jgi:hypothetical protein
MESGISYPRVLDRLLNLRPKRIAAPQLPRINPHILAQIAERLLKVTHEAIVLRAVGDAELAHPSVSSGKR